MTVVKKRRFIRIETVHVITIVSLALHAAAGSHHIVASEELAGLLHEHTQHAHLPMANKRGRRYRLGAVVIEFDE